jgi:hypothetical protein
MSYIPQSDTGFNNWIVNFASLLTANPTSYGEDATVAATVQAVADAWGTAYALAVDPATRTSPTVADKDAAKAEALGTARPVAQRIKLNDSVTNQQRADLGLTVDKTVPTPIAAPTSFPQLAMIAATPLEHKLRYNDSENPAGKAKPFGVIGVEIWRSVGTVEATDPAQAFYDETVTKAPFTSTFSGDDVGKVCTYFARYTTKAGPGGKAQKGPWSSALNVFVI